MPNKVIADVLLESMNEIPNQEWSESDKDFAKKMEKAKANKGSYASDDKNNIALYEGEVIVSDSDSYGSSDVGDVHHICPGIFFLTATTNIGAAGHSWQNTACAGMDIGFKGMIYAAKSMALSGLKFMNDKELVDKAKKDFEKDMMGKEYICPITEELEIK